MADEQLRPRFWDPFGTLSAEGMSQKEVTDIWRAQCWQRYLRGGGGDPRYFDPPASEKIAENERTSKDRGRGR
jgi:hypothetical protein